MELQLRRQRKKAEEASNKLAVSRTANIYSHLLALTGVYSRKSFSKIW